MSEPLDLEGWKKQAVLDLELIFDGAADRARRHAVTAVESAAIAEVWAEVERLRGVVARQAEQITAVRALADRHEDRCASAVHALACNCRYGDIRAVVNA